MHARKSSEEASTPQAVGTGLGSRPHVPSSSPLPSWVWVRSGDREEPQQGLVILIRQSQSIPQKLTLSLSPFPWLEAEAWSAGRAPVCLPWVCFAVPVTSTATRGHERES